MRASSRAAIAAEISPGPMVLDAIAQKLHLLREAAEHEAEVEGG